ncbi:MAG: hypothetical protein AAGC68_07280 [Verrucomicrobiota bacterium]
MKILLSIAALFLILTSVLFANFPSLSATDAIAIAQKDLDDRSLQGEIFIAQMSYRKGSFGEEEHWEVLWSKSFPAQTKGRNEIGLKISMDGNYVRAVR